MLDSLYVRRVAITLQLLDLRFAHESVSVFREFDRFHAINPVVKAPTLVADDGTVLMESTLIIEYAEALAHPRSLRPADPAALLRDLRLTGLALAACDRSIAIIYERMHRPVEKHHAPWVDRVTGQLLAAYGELEAQLAREPIRAASATLTQGALSVAVAWHFTQRMLPEVVAADRFTLLQSFSADAERLPEFRSAPHGGVFGG
jgi:glutathione S-transferase